MSLINDMLRDLDSRNAANSERNGLDRNVRALPGSAAGRSGIHPVVLALGAAALGGGAVWLLLKPQEPNTSIPATIAVVPAPTAKPLPPVEPSLPEVAPTVETSAPDAALRMDTSLVEEPPKVAQPAPTVNTPAPASITSSPVASVSAQPIKAAASPKASAPPTTQAQPQPTGAIASAEPARSNSGAHISKQPSGSGMANEAAEAEYRRGAAAIRRGDLVEGSEALRSALKIWPTHISARQALLALLSDQHRWADAETLALDGIGLYPQRSDWALLAARLMYERGEASGALTLLDQNAGAARQHPDYQILHALLLQRAGRNADAAECYQRALAVRPQESRWWFGLGRALDADHREALARQAYEKARDSGNLPTELQQAVERRLRQG